MPIFCSKSPLRFARYRRCYVMLSSTTTTKRSGEFRTRNSLRSQWGFSYFEAKLEDYHKRNYSTVCFIPARSLLSCPLLWLKIFPMIFNTICLLMIVNAASGRKLRGSPRESTGRARAKCAPLTRSRCSMF